MIRLLDCSDDDLRVRGAAITYRFHDIGYAIDLEHVTKLLISEAAERKLLAILRVGEEIGFGVIAEMVEDQDILMRLKALGVSHAQGFGIQQPRPIADFAAPPVR